MTEPPPAFTAQLFPDLLTGLVDLLSALHPDEWSTPVPRKSWAVHDAALHLLGADVGWLSRERDGFAASTVRAATSPELVAALKALNDTWIAAGRRISPRLLCDLLRFSGEQVSGYVRSLDPHALGGVVSWAGPDPAPNWLGIGQEYTERWHHQQHIREALGRPGFADRRFLQPALEVCMRALPCAYRGLEMPAGTTVAVTVVGDSGAPWFLAREGPQWRLHSGRAEHPAAEIFIPERTAWMLFTKWISKGDALRQSSLRGDTSLAGRAFDATAVIA